MNHLIDTWPYTPTGEDYKSLYNRAPFSSLSYPLRLTVLIVHFHRKFQKGTAKDAYIRFEEATQMHNETIEQWGIKLERYEQNIRRYGAEISFDDFMEKWATGTKPSTFVDELRKAKNQMHPDIQPTIHDRRSFEIWKTAMISNSRQTKHERDKHEALENKHRRYRPKAPRTPARFPSPKRNVDDARQPQNNKKHDGPGYRQAKNLHSTLLKTTKSPTRQNRDMTKVKCYNCNEYGHFASKCPKPKRNRQQRAAQLQALLAETLPSYDEQDMFTPEAVRDKIQLTMQSFMTGIMEVFDPMLESYTATSQVDGDERAEGGDQDKHDMNECEETDEVTHEDCPANAHAEYAESEFTYAEPGISTMTAVLTKTAQLNNATAIEMDTCQDIRSDAETSSTEEEAQTSPPRWTFRECANCPSWGAQVDQEISLLTDMVFPRAQALTHQKGITQLRLDLNEMTQITMWACMLSITTKGELTEIMVECLKSAMKAWNRKNNARGRVLTKCHKLEKTLSPRPILAQQVTQRLLECIRRSTEQALVGSIFAAAGLSSELVGTLEPTTETGVRYEIRARTSGSGEPDNIIVLVQPTEHPALTQNDGRSRVHQAHSQAQASRFLDAWLPRDARPAITLVDPMHVLDATSFWTTRGVNITHDHQPVATTKQEREHETVQKGGPTVCASSTGHNILTVPIKLAKTRHSPQLSRAHKWRRCCKARKSSRCS